MKQTWWKECVIYQIYPRSFMDSNGDGVGDLPGITSKLDYLKDLGISAIWLSPIFQSPMDDNGYDISDYRAIAPEFGSMDDFQKLLDAAHSRGIKLLLDLVVNHTSDEHPWFEKSVRREDPYTDYYIWRDTPNNWESFFSGSVWTYNKQRGQYYLHLFSTKQPDLNWENPLVRHEVHSIANFWLDMGVDGFRLDTVNMYSKAEGLPNVPGEGLQWAGDLFLNGPRIHDYLKELNHASFSRYDCATVGEASGVSPELALQYVGDTREELDMVIQFEAMLLDRGTDAKKWEVQPYDPLSLRNIFIKWQEALAHDGWNCLYLSSHDQPRQVSRFARHGAYRVQGAKMLASILHTLRGTPFVYQGEELGMTNAQFVGKEAYRDIESINAIAAFEEKGVSYEEIEQHIAYLSRDNARTPMHWTSGPNGGFTTGTPWLFVNANCAQINAQDQVDDEQSVFCYYKKLIALRKENPCLVYGAFTNLEQGDTPVFCYSRTLGDAAWYVLINLASSPVSYTLPEGFDADAGLVLSNWSDTPVERQMVLPPYFAAVLKK